MREQKEHRVLKRIFGIRKSFILAIGLAIFDMVFANLAYFLALVFRNDFQYSSIPQEQLKSFAIFFGIYCAIVLVTYIALKLYSSVWKYASYWEVVRIIAAVIITSILHWVLMAFAFQAKMPILYYVGGGFLQFCFTVTARFSYRFIVLVKKKLEADKRSQQNVMIIGAGNAGQMLIRDIQTSAIESNDKVCCLIDDDPNLWLRTIEGIKVVGGRDSILAAAEKYEIQKIYVCIPSASVDDRREILNICKETKCEVSSLPSMYSLASGKVQVRALRKISIEDLLGRPPIKVDLEEILENLRDKVVLVTGGGGSIGSELCRQIATHQPKQLIIFDIYENNAHAIKLELQDNFPNLNLVVLIGSVRDSERINQVFKDYKPDIVYHAAAHKHVPLMEDSPCEAIKNNAIGTYKTAYAAVHNGCKRFILISTDKAVNPTNVMGASKRICEMIIQTFAEKVKANKVEELKPLFTHMTDGNNKDKVLPMPEEAPTTQFVAVRFGNVLGSNGSVIPRFREQIAKGGPVTVTDPNIIRYFMTIPEAVSLVLTAGNYAQGGEIFVLDMGTPMKIDTLARNMIKLAGYEPDVDIKIQYTGLRPGEKMYEEKLMEEEGLRKTKNDLIHIGNPIEFDYDTFQNQLVDLVNQTSLNKREIVELVKQIVVTYHPVDEDYEGKRIKPAH